MPLNGKELVGCRGGGLGWTTATAPGLRLEACVSTLNEQALAEVVSHWHARAVPDTAAPDMESEFACAMRDIYMRAKSEAGYNATYFLQMLSTHGPTETARRLITSTKPSEGFTALWERHRLDLTVEAHVVQDRFAMLFSEAEREAAQQRLTSYGYQPSA